MRLVGGLFDNENRTPDSNILFILDWDVSVWGVVGKKGRKMKPTIVTNWDSMPPEVSANGELFSTRVLCARYKEMEEKTDQQEKFSEAIKKAIDMSQVKRALMQFGIGLK